MSERVRLREVLFELRQVGSSVRVTAIDPVSGIEVVSVGPVGAGQHQLKMAAKRKLEYVIKKHREGAERGRDGR